MKKRETAYKTLTRIAGIKSREDRIAALREELATNSPLATIIQYTYHPEVRWKLPEGDLPDTIATKSEHDEYGPLYSNVRRMYQFRDTFQMDETKRENNYIVMYESIAGEDTAILTGIKDKKLPWRNLGEDFILDAVPELFPPKKTEE